jgi:predicted permease
MIRMLRRTWRRLLGSLPFRKADHDLAEELEAHIHLLAEENIRRGMAPQEAYRQARIKFGNVESMKERYRDERGLPFLDSTAQDLRYAIRVLSKNRGFATVAILSLAIGIGANTAIFSLVNGVLLRPLDYPDPGRLFAVREVQIGASRGMGPVNPAHALAWADACPSIEHVAVLRSSRGQLSAAGSDPATLPGARVTHNFFTLLGVTPLLGRTFFAEEAQPGRDRVIILSEALWRARFNADPSVVGKPVLVDGVDHEVIGVVRGSFWRSFGGGIQNTPSDGRYELFRPLGFSAEELARVSGNYNYAALVRLKPGVTAEQAVAEMNVVQARFPRGLMTPGGLEAMLIPLRELVTGRSLGLWMLTAAVGAVLLIVCFNLANLLLSRAASRSRETAVRSALGASRLRQFRQLLTESLVLAAAGGVLGVVFAVWSVQVLAGSGTVDLPRLAEVRVDPMVMLFAAGVTLLTSVVFGVLPAWRLTRRDLNHALRASGRTITDTRGGLRLRGGLIGLEVSLSTALLIVAALLTASLDRLLRVDKGFDVEQVLTFDLDTAGPAYDKPVERGQFFARVVDKIEAIPGVAAAGLITQLPLEGNTWNDPIYLIEDGSRSERHAVDNRFSSPGYFQAMSINILHGRAFDESDRGRSVAVLSVKAAQLLWPGEVNPVGRQFMGEDDVVKTLVGVVADVRASLHDNPPPHAYYPYWQRVPGDVVMVVRTSSGPDTMAAPIRAALHSEDPNLPLAPIRAMQDLVDGAVQQRRFQSTLVVVFAVSALLVASLGIYGVVSYSVARRRNEIGIRMALGAKRSQLLKLIVTQSMTPVALGTVAGIIAALLLGRAIRGLLFEVQPSDPATIAAVAVILLVVGAMACVVPARRATRANTIDALRLE